MQSRLSEIFTGMQGRWTRLKIIEKLNEEPQNTNQLKTSLKMDYKSIQRNLKILEENNIISKVGGGYGEVYFLSDYLIENIDSLEEVIKKVEKKLSRKKVYI